MKLRTLQWNIGGGIIRNVQDAPDNSELYVNDDITYIVDYINQYDPDIVTFEEIHTNQSSSQPSIISQQTNLKYSEIFPLTPSHLKKDEILSLAILSKFPLTKLKQTKFFNPHWKLQRENGEIWDTHDKGVLSAEIKIAEKTLKIKTLHLIPFRKYDKNLNSVECKELKLDIFNKVFSLNDDQNILVQGDFNLDTEKLVSFFPEMKNLGMEEIEINENTTPRGRKYDHIVYKGLILKSFKIDNSVLTDHYPILAEFEF